MLYGNPNKIISEVGTKLMNNQRLAKLLYYADKINTEFQDIEELPDIENPISVLKNNKVFYNRRFDKIFKRADAGMFIRMGEFNLKNSKFIDRCFIEIGVTCHEKYLNTLNGDRNLCLIDTVQKVIEDMRYIGDLKFIRALPIRDLPVEYEGYCMLLEIRDYNENNINR